MSTSSVSSSAWASWGRLPGRWSTSPACTTISSRLSSPTKNFNAPSRTYVSCSFVCECFGTTQPFFKYTCASISWSPVIRRRDSLSFSSSRGMSSQRYQVAARLALTTVLRGGGEQQRYPPCRFRASSFDAIVNPKPDDSMRKLKLQVQMSVDGFVAGPEGQLDWMTEHDAGVIARIVQITDASDTILLGRKMTDGVIKYWESVPPESPEYLFARQMVEPHKGGFSKTLQGV